MILTVLTEQIHPRQTLHWLGLRLAQSGLPPRLLPLALVSIVLLVGAAWAWRSGRGSWSRVLATAAAIAAFVFAAAPVVVAPARPLSEQVQPDASEYADAARRLATGQG